ncbi:MAG: SDR family oxidoreductase [Clostridiales bacterium]|nr:SDR family oxidoreductase [Clostridiales bacterium]
MMDLKGKTAIISGGGRGIGKVIALDLAREGCNIAVSSRNESELNEVVKEAEAIGVSALGLQLDLSEEQNVTDLVDRIIDRFNSVDILINNAGIILPRPFLEVSLEEWDKTMNINLRAAFILSQKVLNIMKEKRSGYIINISSTVALSVPSHLASYGASKCGMVGLSQALYETAKEFCVKVSTIYPGITDTKMVRDLNPSHSKPGQWMLPEDISYCVMFLLKQSNRMIVKDIVPWSTGYDKI